MKKLTNNQKAFLGVICIFFAWILGLLFETLIPEFLEWLLFFLFHIIGVYLIWPMAKDIDKFNNMHNKKF